MRGPCFCRERGRHAAGWPPQVRRSGLRAASLDASSSATSGRADPPARSGELQVLFAVEICFNERARHPESTTRAVLAAHPRPASRVPASSSAAALRSARCKSCLTVANFIRARPIAASRTTRYQRPARRQAATSCASSIEAGFPFLLRRAAASSSIASPRSGVQICAGNRCPAAGPS